MRHHYLDRHKQEYLLHPQLMDYIQYSWRQLLQVHFVFWGFFALISDYPTILIAMDATVTALICLYWYVVKPMMMKGSIPAFYRRNYNDVSIMMWIGKWFLQGAVLRTAMMTAFYVVCYGIAHGDSKEVGRFWDMLNRDFSDPLPALVGVGIFVFYIFLFFYGERYISIKEFSNRIISIARNQGVNLDVALQRLVYEKDQELEKVALEQVKYDGEAHYAETVKENRPKPILNESPAIQQHEEPVTPGGSVELPIHEKVAETTHPTPIRRQARK